MVWPMASIKNMNPILPWTAPIGEWTYEPIQWRTAKRALTNVRNARMASQRVTGDFCFRNLCTHDFQLKWRYRCHMTLAKNRQPITTWVHTHTVPRLPVASSCMDDASMNAVVNTSVQSHNLSFRAFVILSVSLIWDIADDPKVFRSLSKSSEYQ